MIAFVEIVIMLVSGMALIALFLGLIWLLIDFVFFDTGPGFFSDFERRWPPINDDEFIRRCSPDVDRDIALRVRRIVSEQLGIPYEQIYPEQNFVNDLDCR